MHGLREPSFLPTKKNPALAGDDDGWIIPAARDSKRYFSTASVSGLDRENVPDSRSIAQSYGLCGSRQVARDLQKTSLRSWFSAGTVARLGAASTRGTAAGE